MSSKQALSSTIILTEEEKDKLIKLGGLRWTLEDIATFFGWSLKSLEKEMKNPDSEVRACILKGELQVQFALEDRLRTDAVGGNLSAVKQFSDNLKDRSFKMTKLESHPLCKPPKQLIISLFGGFLYYSLIQN